MSSPRQAIPGEKVQGEDESIPYDVTTTPWGTNPTSVSVVVKDRAGTVVTTTVMPSGSPTVAGDKITLPHLLALTRGRYYRVEVKFTVGGKALETFFIIKAEQ